MKNKKAYFQGGGGENEPTPGKRKYKAEPCLVDQPRFEEPLYRNYDLYDVAGKYGPGSGYTELQKHKSVEDFLKFRRKKLKGKYVADDTWTLDSGEKTKKNPNIKARAAVFNRIIKNASGEEHYTIKCKKCDSIVGQCRCMSHDKVTKFVDSCPNCTEKGDKNDGRNFDMGQGPYSNMDKLKTITDESYLVNVDDKPDNLKKFYEIFNEVLKSKKNDSNNLADPDEEQTTPIVWNSAAPGGSQLGIMDGMYPEEDLEDTPVGNLYYGETEMHRVDF